MIKKPITNEMLSNYYRGDMAIFGYGDQQKAIAKRIKECPINFYDYYVKHGTLKKLDPRENLK